MLHRVVPILLTASLLATPQVVVAQSINQLFQQGIAAQSAGNFSEAERIFLRVIRLEANNPYAYYYLGLALYEQGKLDEALTNYQQAEAIANYQQTIRLKPKFAYAYHNLGFALYAQGELKEAIANYQQAIRFNPNYARAYNGLGATLYAQGKLDKAIANYQQAIRLKPNYGRAYNNLGLALYIQGKLDEAIANYQQAIRLKPDYAKAYNNLGIALYKQGKLDEAIANYQQAIRLKSKFAYAYNNLGLALYEQGKLDEAIANYQRALNLPDQKGTVYSAHTLAHSNLGNALRDQGKLDEAIAEYKGSIDLNRNYVIAKNNLREAKRLLALRRDPQTLAINEQKNIPTEEEEPLVKVLRSTARIIAEVSGDKKIGTGWVVKRQGNILWIVTNRHVISDKQSKRRSDNIEVEFFSELPDEKRPRYKAKIEKMTDFNDELDLTVLKVKGIPDDIQPLKFRRGRVSRNTPVRVIGHPFTVDDPWNSASGEVTNYNPGNPRLPIKANVAEGNSGGPVINEKMEVIAVIVSYRNKSDLALDPNQPSPDISQISEATEGISLAYRIDIVLEKLRQWRILN
ncbi:MAG: tetratricopeptide repeat protein [Symploca sp. SIO2E9]|nr:tetratricopeptide repeat protein [Symploca sp. SIO2E9]